MKFIHTADWHLGNSMHDIDRTEESRRFLAWLKEQILAVCAEALVVAGDIFDTVNPSNETKNLYYCFLASLLGTPCKNVIIVGGNHDSATLLDAPSEILNALNIQVVGSICGRSVDSLVRELFNEKGEAIGICATVPYAREPELRPFVTDKSENFSDNAYRGLYGSLWNAAEERRAGRNIPMLATGHLYAAGLEGRPENDLGEGMRNHGVRDIVGNLGTVPVTVFPEGFDYVALGHIHYATTVAKNPKVRYSGSPFVLGFDEAKIPHHILLVDASFGKIPEVTKIEVPQYFKFVRVEGSTEEIRSQLRELSENPHSQPVKVEIVYEYKVGINIRDELKSVLESPAFEVVSWRTARSGMLTAGDYADDNLDSVKELGEEEIFKRLIMRNAGVTEMNEDVQKNFDEFWPLFQKLIDEVEKDC